MRAYKVYLAIKFIAEGGQVRKKNLDLEQVADLCGYSSVTSVYSHLNTCLELNWIGTDGQWYFIRSFDRLRAEYEAESRTGSEIRPEDVATLDQFLLGAKIQHWIRSKKHVRKIGSTKPTQKEQFSCLHGINKDYQPNAISCSIIADWFNVSTATASRLKQRARASGYLHYRNRTNRLRIPAEHIDNVRGNVAPATYLTTYKRGRQRFIAIRLTDAFTFGKDEHSYKYSTRCSI